jgi:hypothetical protein
MKKIILYPIIILVCIISASFTSSGKKEKAPIKPMKIFGGWFSGVSSNGNSVTVEVSWNTLKPLNQRVVGAVVTGSTTFTTTFPLEQYPRMNLVNGTLVASGWRCNFTYSGGASDYIVYSGNLNMY